MPSHKRVLALAALAALVVAALFAPPASADWCSDQKARCLKRCGGKEADMDFDCRDKNNARSVSCSCTNGNSGFSGGENGASSFAGSGSGSGVGAGSFAGTGFGVGGMMTPDQVARDGFNNVARVARGESPFFGGGDASGGSGNSGGGSGGGGSKQPGNSEQQLSSKDASTSQATSTPSWAIALAVLASLVAASCAGALGFVVMKRNHDRKAAALATPSLPMFEAKPSAFAPSSPSKAGHATL